MKSILILNAQMVNEGKIQPTDIFIKEGIIEKIATNLSHLKADICIDAQNQYALPGVIDDQVHFREPGLTHKATIRSEAIAAVAGGVTSFMEMPNTVPQATTQALLAEKYAIAEKTSLANYSFFMGTTNDNIEEIMRTNPKEVCGIKIFMGSSTGSMLVDNPQTLEKVFANSPMLIATHCEDEATVKKRQAMYEAEYGDSATAALHPLIRNEEACAISSHLAIQLAKKHQTRLHILHISTAEEIALFENQTPLAQKKITSEVCVHHLWFSADDYAQLGNLIKCNPAIKAKHHREALWDALLNDYFDVIATDHAPHTWEEKQQSYWKAPAGLPLVQYALPMMLEKYQQGKISLEKIVEKMCHNPAICFQIEKRGFLREGYWADIALIDLQQPQTISKNDLHYHCQWSPLENATLRAKVTHTIVSGHLAYQNGIFDHSTQGKRLYFER